MHPAQTGLQSLPRVSWQALTHRHLQPRAGILGDHQRQDPPPGCSQTSDFYGVFLTTSLGVSTALSQPEVPSSLVPRFSHGGPLSVSPPLPHPGLPPACSGMHAKPRHAMGSGGVRDELRTLWPVGCPLSWGFGGNEEGRYSLLPRDSEVGDGSLEQPGTPHRVTTEGCLPRTEASRDRMLRRTETRVTCLSCRTQMPLKPL